MNICEKFENDKAILKLSGRLDANSSLKLKESLCNSINKGKLDIILDFEKISEISSSGKNFLEKNYKNIVEKNGSLCVINPTEKINDILNQENLSYLIYKDEIQETNESRNPSKLTNIENTNFRFYDPNADNSQENNCLYAYGNPDKLLNKSFINQDPFLLDFNEKTIGLGLGSLSTNIEESIDVFGEYTNIGSYSFHIPSFKDSIPDYEICKENGLTKINNLYGITSKNNFRYFTSFESENENHSLKISDLIKILMNHLEKKAIHFVLFGEINGVYGVKLTKSPFINKKESIFEKKQIENNFKIIKEDTYNHKICAIVGYAINEANPLVQKFLKLYDEESSIYMHAHCVTFEHQKLNLSFQNNINDIISNIMKYSAPSDLFHLIKNNKNHSETSLYNGICFFDSLDEFKTGEF